MAKKLALFVILLATAVSLSTSAQMLVGEDGAAGIDGISGDPGTPGTDGNIGESVIFTVDEIGVAVVEATTIGGNGGAGGTGGDGVSASDANGSNAGIGGDGGASNTTATSTVESGDVHVTSTAHGGHGGLGGTEGSYSGVGIPGVAGDGGSGGAATATSNAVSTDDTGTTRVSSNSEAIGGNGGLTDLGTYVTQVFPNLGPEYIPIGGIGGDAESNAFINAQNVLSAEAHSVAIGGIGADPDFLGLPGYGGNASASSTATVFSTTETLHVSSTAIGGDIVGGDLYGSINEFDQLVSADGGDAHASAYGSAQSGDVLVEAYATGGLGAGAHSGFTMPAVAGYGGTATLGTVYGESLDGGTVTVIGSAQGGESGFGQSGASAQDGVSSVLINAIDGFTTGSLVLDQRAVGGEGGGLSYVNLGDGGLAQSTLSRSGAFESLQIITSAIGGGSFGSDSESLEEDEVGNGGAAIADSRTENSTGVAIAQASAQAGKGGNTVADVDYFAGNGGIAEAIASADTSSGGTEAHAIAIAQGGRSGRASGGFSYGGDAIATATAVGSGNGGISATAEARGGNGAPEVFYEQPGLGGKSIAFASATNSGNADVFASAYARASRDNLLNPERTSAIASGISTGSGNVVVSVVQEGTTNTSGPQAEGFPEAVILINQASGSTRGELTLEQTALGSQAWSGYAPGVDIPTGGFASSTLDLTETVAASTKLTSRAIGGRGKLTSSIRGSGGHAEANSRLVATGTATAIADAIGGEGGMGYFDYDHLGNEYQFGGTGGGDAFASATAISLSQSATATASATGGDGFNTLSDDINLYDGDATAVSSAEAFNQEVALAYSTALGSLSTATSNATVSGGPVSSLNVQSHAEELESSVHATLVEARSRAVIGGSELVAEFANSTHSVVGLPDRTLLESVFSGNVITEEFLENSGAGLLVGSVGAAYGLDDEGSLFVSSIADFSIDTTSLYNNELFLALANPSVDGAGFVELDFQVFVNDTLIVDQSFTNWLDALAFFDDQVLSLGEWITGAGVELDISVHMDALLSELGDGVSFNYAVVTNVPLPPAALLLLSGLVVLSGISRRRST